MMGCQECAKMKKQRTQSRRPTSLDPKTKRVGCVGEYNDTRLCERMASEKLISLFRRQRRVPMFRTNATGHERAKGRARWVIGVERSP